MKKLDWFLFAAIAWAAAGSLAARAAVPVDAENSPVGDPVGDALVEYARPYVRTLSREINVYHWTQSQNIVGEPDPRPLAPMDARTRGYAKYVKETFWDPKAGAHGGAAGNGLYVALDPVSSRSYGDTLLQIVMPAGTRFLVEGEGAFTPKFPEIVGLAGCPANFLAELFQKAPGYPPCMELRNRLVHALDLQAFRYSYDSSIRDVCQGNGPWAFVLFDDRAINADRIVAFPVVPGRAPPTDAHSDNRMLLEALASRAATSLWGLSPIAWAPSQVDPWVRTNLYGCGQYAEDK